VVEYVFIFSKNVHLYVQYYVGDNWNLADEQMNASKCRCHPLTGES